MGKVTTAEAKRVGVAKWLKERGYVVTQFFCSDEYDSNSWVSIDIDRISPPRRSLTHLLCTGTSYMPVSHLVAQLWLSRPNIGANRKNWVLHVYGRNNMAEFSTQAEALARQYDVDIHVRLEGEDPVLREHFYD
jgi:hypothetical protein